MKGGIVVVDGPWELGRGRLVLLNTRNKLFDRKMYYNYGVGRC